MNTYSVPSPQTKHCNSNGGDYLAEGMWGMKQLSARALTPAA